MTACSKLVTRDQYINKMRSAAKKSENQPESHGVSPVVVNILCQYAY